MTGIKCSARALGAIAALGLCALATACVHPTSPSAGGSRPGKVTLKLGFSVPSAKTVTADLANSIAKLDIGIWSGPNQVAGQTNIGYSNPFPGTSFVLDPAVYTVKVDAFGDAGETELVATGSASADLSEGGTTVTVSLNFTQTAATGGFSLKIQWPLSTGLASVSATLNQTDAVSVSNQSTDATYYYATLSLTGVSGGSHRLDITFKTSSGASSTFGPYFEAVNVWDNVTSTKWIDSSGNLKDARVFLADEFLATNTRLEGLALTNATTSVPFDPGTTVYTINSVSSPSIAFTACLDSATQSISYSWDGGAAGSFAPVISGVGYISTPLILTGGGATDTLAITVSSPNGMATRTYTITATCKNLSYDPNGAWGGDVPVSEPFVPGQSLIIAPNSGELYSGLDWVGWNTKPDGSGTGYTAGQAASFSTDTTLYAWWKASVGVDLGLPISGSLTFSALCRYAVQGSAYTATCADPTLAAIPTGWTWYLDGALQPGQTGATFTLSAAQTSAMNGDYLVSCALSSGGLGYSGSFKLSVMKNLVVTGATPAEAGDNLVQALDANPSGNWTLGCDAQITNQIISVGGGFTGCFDGAGHTVTLSDNTGAYRNWGLFEEIGTGGTVKNLKVVCNIVGTGDFIGAIAGLNLGTIEHCSSSGTISASWDVGGLVGQNGEYSNSGTIRECYSTVNVTGHEAGGLVGAQGEFAGYGGIRSYIIDSYARGSVSAPSGNAGGLVGFQRCYGDIASSYATGFVTGLHAGGLVGGQDSSPTITSSYYDIISSGRSDTGKGAGLITSDMKISSKFSGWDFGAVWAIDSTAVINAGYPYLQFFGAGTANP